MEMFFSVVILFAALFTGVFLSNKCDEGWKAAERRHAAILQVCERTCDPHPVVQADKEICRCSSDFKVKVK